jgi:hypothetical protein
MYVIQHCFICRPSDSTVSEDAGIEPRTVATLALTVRRSNYSARSHQSRYLSFSTIFVYYIPTSKTKLLCRDVQMEADVERMDKKAKLGELTFFLQPVVRINT